MARNVVLLSDGTGNSAAKLFKTNVWRTYQALDVSNANQIAFYDNGVGTSSFKPLAILGGAFGWGLKRNIIEMYMFLCRNYEPGDRIFGFGFSRGAFTIRVLTNFLLSEGLVKNYGSTGELKRKSLEWYRAFRKKETTGYRFSELIRSIAYLIHSIVYPVTKPPAGDIKREPITSIEFLGLWDTVDAYGLPIEEFKTGIDRYVWPLALMDRQLDGGIKKACHALSIDDTRKTFHPLLWDETNEPHSSDARYTDEERLTQVWFVGVHSNVGGGYPDDGLSFVSLRWMMHEASKKELIFKSGALKEVDASATLFGRLYHSRAGVGAYYRYEPRRLNPPIVDRQGAQILRPKIHESVIWRMALDTSSYAPLSLPMELRIVTDDRNGNSGLAGDPKRCPNIYEFERYQNACKTDGHLFGVPIGINFDKTKQEQIASKISKLRKPDPEAVKLMWDTVWCRQVVYFVTLAATIWLVLYPALPSPSSILPVESIGRVTGEFPPVTAILAVFESVARSVEPVARSAIKTAISFFPDFTRWWFEKYLESTWDVILLCLVIVGLLRLGSLLDHRIHDRALAAWNSDFELNRVSWFQRHTIKRIASSCVVAFALALCVWVFGSRGIEEIEKLERLRFFIPFYDLFPPPILDTAFPVFLFTAACAAGALCIGALVYATWAYRRTKQVDHQQRELPGFALCLSRIARTWKGSHWVHRCTTRFIVPTLFAALVVISALVLIIRVPVTFMSVCKEKDPTFYQLTPGQKREFDFDIKNGCFDSEIKLESGKRYRIDVVSGESLPKWWWKLAWPMQRQLTAPGFIPIVQVGATGIQEFVIANPNRNLVIQPQEGGRLFTFLNDAPVLDWFYRSGDEKTWKVSVARCPDSETRSNETAC
jgi:type VI secretion system (T6SS) phospholipase Tle1-like effector